MHAAWLAALAFALPVDDSRRWEDEVVYGIILEKFFYGDPSNNVMSQRFARDRLRFEGGFWGGDLKGVRAKLDDLVELGITTILLYPVVQNDERPIAKFLPTGYRPKDYEHVDRNFGDISTLRALVDAAHARRLRVILDLPISLPGFEHPYLADPAKKAWFGPPTAYGVPRWKAENPEVADYLIGIAARWKERSGCDGFRIDSAQLQPVSFWKRFVAALKADPPGPPFLILAELPLNPREIGKILADAGFDGAYDFSAMQVREVFGKDHDVGMLSFVAKEAARYYPSPRTLMGPIDNYEDAFVSIARAPKPARTRLALTYILTIDRVPLLYAGNELGIAFKDVGGAFPPDRRASPFLKEVKGLIALRTHEPALRRGTFAELLARDGVDAFVRTLGEDCILVVLNGSVRPRSFAMPIAGHSWKASRLDDLIAGAIAKPAGDEAALEVSGFGARILRVR